MAESDRTAAVRKRGVMLVDALAFVRTRVRDAFGLSSTEAASMKALGVVGARDGTPSTTSSRSRAALTVSHLFARGDDVLGVARADLDEAARPEALESGLLLVVDVLETTRVCIATLRGALAPDDRADASLRTLLVRADERARELGAIADELLARARVAVGQELYRRATRVVKPERIDAVVLRALRAEGAFFDLLDERIVDEAEREEVARLLRAFAGRLSRDLASETMRRARSSPAPGPLPGFVLKLVYPDVVDVGAVVTLVAHVRNDLARPLCVVALDLDDELAGALEIETVTPPPLSRAPSDDALSLAFDLVIEPLESRDIVVTAVARRAGVVTGEISAWTDSADVALGVVTLDVVQVH